MRAPTPSLQRYSELNRPAGKRSETEKLHPISQITLTLIPEF